MSETPREFFEADQRLAAARSRRASGRHRDPTPVARGVLRLVPPSIEVIAKNEALIAAEEARREARRRTQESRAAEERMRRSRALLSDCGLKLTPEAIELIVREQLAETPVLAAIRAWFGTLQGPGAKRCVFLLGPVGTGKTVGAGECIHRRGEGRAVKARRLVTLEASGWGDARTEYEALVEAPIAIVDELGKEGRGYNPDHEIEAVCEFIDDRIGKDTIVIGNLTLKQLKDDKRKNLRLASRLHEIGHFIDCAGPDLRRVSPDSLRRRS